MQTDQHKHRFRKKSSNRILIVSILALSLLGSCGDSTMYHPSLNLCESYSLKQLTDSIYSDTLRQSDFYPPYIKKVVEQVEINCQDSLHRVYPFEEFDEVIYYSNTWEIFGNELNGDEVYALLGIINDPLNFGWSETTFIPEDLIVFKRDGEEIARLEIMGAVVKSKPESTLMKFGALSDKGYDVFWKYIDEI